MITFGSHVVIMSPPQGDPNGVIVGMWSHSLMIEHRDHRLEWVRDSAVREIEEPRDATIRADWD